MIRPTLKHNKPSTSTSICSTSCTCNNLEFYLLEDEERWKSARDVKLNHIQTGLPVSSWWPTVHCHNTINTTYRHTYTSSLNYITRKTLTVWLQLTARLPDAPPALLGSREEDLIKIWGKRNRFVLGDSSQFFFLQKRMLKSSIWSVCFMKEISLSRLKYNDRLTLYWRNTWGNVEFIPDGQTPHFPPDIGRQALPPEISHAPRPAPEVQHTSVHIPNVNNMSRWSVRLSHVFSQLGRISLFHTSIALAMLSSCLNLSFICFFFFCASLSSVNSHVTSDLLNITPVNIYTNISSIPLFFISATISSYSWRWRCASSSDFAGRFLR